MTRRAILIFARNPREEAAAKRLPQLEPVFAAVIAGWRRAADSCSAASIIASDQRGSTFGARLFNAATDAFASGFETLLITGIDVPPLHSIEQAFIAAENGEVAIAPSTDGGVNAIVLQQGDAAILATFELRDANLARRCIESFVDRVFLLTRCTDIDSAESFRVARGEILWQPYLSAAFVAFEQQPARTLLASFTTQRLRAPPRVSAIRF